MRGDWNRWETETLETKVVSNGVEGVPGYPDGEGRHVRELVKNSRRHSEASGEEGEQIKGPRRKIIRVGIRRNTGLCERSK